MLVASKIASQRGSFEALIKDHWRYIVYSCQSIFIVLCEVFYPCICYDCSCEYQFVNSCTTFVR